MLPYSANGFVVDNWEVEAEQVLLDGELGEGAFGKVYKGTLYELPTPVRKPSLIGTSMKRKTLKMDKGYEVAIKMLQGRIIISVVNVMAEYKVFIVNVAFQICHLEGELA